MTDEEHARKYARESISLAISMYNPKAEDIAFFACLYGLTYKNDEIKELKQQIEKMKCCGNCKGVCNSDDVAYFCKNNGYKLWEIK